MKIELNVNASISRFELASAQTKIKVSISIICESLYMKAIKYKAQIWWWVNKKHPYIRLHHTIIF